MRSANGARANIRRPRRRDKVVQLRAAGRHLSGQGTAKALESRASPCGRRVKTVTSLSYCAARVDVTIWDTLAQADQNAAARGRETSSQGRGKRYRACMAPPPGPMGVDDWLLGTLDLG